MAPKAKLIANDFSNILVNTPVYAGDYNMVLSNNSYYNGLAGCPGEGQYDALSNYIDDQLVSYPKILHVFAAGNDGPYTCSAFPASFATIKSGFQTAKDVLTVGNFSNADYTISYTSSRGPVADGRIKPELVAGGVNINSTLPYNTYGGMNGTSMASPTATGVLTLLYERWRQLHSGADPDAALIKALVVNSGDDLGNPGPDYTYGFGMLNGRKAAEAMEQNHYFTGTATNGSLSHFAISAIPAGSYQLKIILYWPDQPAQPYSPAALINDLDLLVTDPGGTTHLPLVLDSSSTGVNNIAVEGADHTNNIEQVVINNPAAGDFTLTVKGTAIAQGPQPFYIAYEILQPSVTVEFPFGAETLAPGELTTIRWTPYGGDGNTFTVEYSTDGGSNWNLISSNVPSTARSISWLVPNLSTTQALVRVTRNTVGYSDVSDYPFTILGQPVLAVTKPCVGYAQLTWNKIPGADHYQVMQLMGDSMQTIATITDTSFLVSPLSKDSSYWFSVRAVSGGTVGRRAIAGNIIPNGGPCTLTALNNDLVADNLVAPVTGRKYSSSQLGPTQLRVTVRNSGSIATSSPVTFSYQVNGGPTVSEIYSGSLPAHISGIYTFSAANSYDFSAPGTYIVKTWTSYSPDPVSANDTTTTIVRQLSNDPITLAPSFMEGFESATNQSPISKRTGLDSLDRADFNNSNSNGRLSTFFNSGFARTGNRSITLDVINSGTVAADSMITTFNLSNYSAADQIWLDLYYKKQSVVPTYPGNAIWIRGNDQAVWIPVKGLSDPTDPTGTYIHVNVDVSGILASASPAQTVSSSFQVRCGVEGYTPAASPIAGGVSGGGITFDDFMLTKSLNDAALSTVLQPNMKNICGLSNAEAVTIKIKNYSTDSLHNIPVTYAINGDTVTETIPFIKPKDSLTYTFTKTADMSAFGAYLFKTWVSDPDDNYHNNDSSQSFFVQTTPLISQYPYLEGFENNNGYWFTNGINDDWQWGRPQKTIIHKAANGNNAWVTRLTGNYSDNEYAYLYSPCFDLSSLNQPVLSFSHIFKTEDDCDCDFHWVEYSLDDSVWTVLGDNTTGVNWYDKAAPKAWQQSVARWHVSSIDIPVHPSKIRFRIVMYSDPGTNDEGVGIDDVHVFDKAPVFTDSLQTSITQPVSGTDWMNFDLNGKRIFSINPNGQDLGNTRLSLFNDSGAVRDTAGQYYGGRNWVVRTDRQPLDSVGVRYYFTDSEINKLLFDTACSTCVNPEDAYSVGVTQYSSPDGSEEDSTLRNNIKGSYLFHKPQQDIQVIPYDNGYYAETKVAGFSEFWINAGGIKQDHPLAAWLKDFTAVRVGAKGQLQWDTWQEIASRQFVIERSPDSVNFTEIGTLPAQPHLDSIQSYQFIDPNLLKGENYYRLKLIYDNGDSLYSPVRRIDYDSSHVVIGIYPNPTNDWININTTSECHDIQVFDVSGRLLIRRRTSGTEQRLFLGSLARGVYVLKIWTDAGTRLAKIEKR
ncbi:MAG TPA: S8 family peptidase [Puia sp.]|nr:S8 family peptidase [Puia sp.]